MRIAETSDEAETMDPLLGVAANALPDHAAQPGTQDEATTAGVRATPRG